MTLFFLLLDWLLFIILAVIAIGLARDIAKAVETGTPVDPTKGWAAVLLLLSALRLVAP